MSHFSYACKTKGEPEIFPIFQHKVERIPHFAHVTEVRHIFSFILKNVNKINRNLFAFTDRKPFTR